MSRHGDIHKIFEGINGQEVTRYKDGFFENIECINYNPCPICRRCENYNRYSNDCLSCQVDKDYHTTKEKALIGGRDKSALQSR